MNTLYCKDHGYFTVCVSALLVFVSLIAICSWNQTLWSKWKTYKFWQESSQREYVSNLGPHTSVQNLVSHNHTTFTSWFFCVQPSYWSIAYICLGMKLYLGLLQKLQQHGWQQWGPLKSQHSETINGLSVSMEESQHQTVTILFLGPIITSCFYLWQTFIKPFFEVLFVTMSPWQYLYLKKLFYGRYLSLCLFVFVGKHFLTVLLVVLLP